MSMYINFDNYDQYLLDHAKKLLTYWNLYRFDKKGTFKRSGWYNIKVKSLLTNPIQAHVCWNAFSLGVEILIKAVLMRNKVLVISKGLFPTSQDPAVQGVYNNYLNFSISGTNGNWIYDEMVNAGITQVSEIKFSTFHPLVQNELKMLVPSKLTQTEYDILHDQLMLLKNVRRNPDAHNYFKRIIVGSMNGDIDIYIDAINKLVSLY